MDRPSPCIGLFGTCGGSKWRVPFIQRFSALHFNFFNPQVDVDEWKEEYSEVEAEHFVNDEIILFPITDETDGLGSLSEVLNMFNNSQGRDFVIMIHKTVDPEKVTDPAVAKASNRTRALVTAHLKKLDMPNVLIVPTLEAMIMAADELYRLRRHQFELDARRAALSRFTKVA
ncbi:MAG: hypothetical protein ABIP74_01715 [Candidatus Saccharimonas sp.]